MPKNMPIILVAVLVIVVILLMTCAVQVRFTEAAVITRFDRIRDVITPDQAGLHWKWPWPFEDDHKFDARLRTFETEFQQQGTKDQRTVVVTVYATWRIADPETFYKAIGSSEEAAVVKIRDKLNDTVSLVLLSYPLSALVNTDPKEMKLSEIEGRFLSGIKDDVLHRYGIAVESAGITRLGLPESVTREVFARMKVDRQKTIKELTAQGQAKAKEIQADAEEKANKILARADAYAKKIEAEGVAQAAKYNKFFEQNRELSDFLKSRDTLLQILKAGQITLVLNADDISPFELIKRGAEALHGGGAKTDNPKSGNDSTAQNRETGTPARSTPPGTNE